MNLLKRALIIIICIFVCSLQINALDTTDFKDASLQKRYQNLTDELRCLVCQNETIAGSSSELAQDLRKQVAEQLRAGQSDEQIRAYMTERYGEFILYRPSHDGKTKILWLAPLVFLLLLAFIFIAVLIKKNNEVINDGVIE